MLLDAHGRQGLFTGWQSMDFYIVLGTFLLFTGW